MTNEQAQPIEEGDLGSYGSVHYGSRSVKRSSQEGELSRIDVGC
jgi:hypothetical protein